MQILSYTDYNHFTKSDVFVEAFEDTITRNDGKKFLDLNSGLWNVNFGYTRPDILQALTDQYNKLAYYPNHFWSETNVSKLYAERLCKLLNYNSVYFSNSGSEAVEIALSDIKGKIYAPFKSYHGSTQRTKNLSFFSKNYEATNKLSNNVSAVLIEPILGNTGVYSISQEQVEEINYYKDKFNYIIICDETTTGMGRCGHLSFSKTLGINADRLIVSKGLTNGVVPLSATLFKDSPSSMFMNGFTQSGNSLACAVGNRVLDLIKTIEQDKIIEINKLLELLNVNFRQYGFMIGIDVQNARIVRKKLFDNGYLVRNFNDETIILSPMFITKISKIKEFFKNFKELL